MKKLLRLGMVAVLLYAPVFLSAQCASDLIISEYVEGSGNNKFIEIYNNTGAGVDLSNYTLRIYFNGSASFSSITLSASPLILADGAVFIVANSGYSTTTYTGTVDLATGSLQFNGNDVVALAKSGTNIEVIGTIGSGTNFAQNLTLQRQSSVTAPVATYNSSEWTVLGTDDVSGLGSHTMNCSVVPCTTPNSNAMVTLTPYLNSIDVSITPPTGGADGYFTIIKTVNSIAAPTNTTSYTIGDPYDGGTIIGFGGTTSFTASGLTPNTTYYVFVFAYNSSGCSGGPVYASSVSISTTTLVANPTTLNPGDMVIVGFDTYTGGGGPDRIVVTNFKALGTGTTFLIANAVYENKANPSERTDRWYSGNDNYDTRDVPIMEITYQGVGLPAGSVICMDFIGLGNLGTVTISGVDVSSQFAETDPGTSKFVQLSSSNADALFLMQGTFTNGLIDSDGDRYGTLDANGRVLGGLQTAGIFQDFTVAGDAAGTRVSRVHPDIECFAISTGGTSGGFFGYYNVAVNTINDTQHNLLKAIADFGGNWVSGTTSGTTGDTDDISAVICDPLLSFNVLSSAVSGNWIGDTDQDWFNCLNWDNLQVPDEATDVTIGGDALDDCEVDVSVYSANAAKFDNIAVCNDIFISSGSFKLEVSSSITDTLVVNGDLTLAEGSDPAVDDGGILDMTDGANGGTIVIKGDWFEFNQPSNRFDEGIGGKVLFNGSSPQSITVLATGTDPNEGEDFSTLEIDNPTGLSLLGRVSVTREAIFTDGIISSESGTASGASVQSARDIFVIDEAGIVSGVSDASHVDGIVSKIGSTDFTFPVGDGTYYRPAGLIGAMGGIATDEFRAEFFSANPSAAFTASNASGVTNAEYWIIDRTVGSASKAVELTWDQAKTSNVNDPAVVRLNTVANPMTDYWELAGGNGRAATSGAGATGTVSSVLVTDFSPFTLSDANPFPIELIYFKGSRKDQEVLLSWETSLELNNSHFILERSSDNKLFREIANVPASGAGKGAYQWLDKKPQVGKNYYRLVQVDFDGSSSTSHTIEVSFLGENQSGLWVAYPNPVKNRINFDLQLTESSLVQLMIFDLKGRQVRRVSELLPTGQNSLEVDASALSSGFYHYEILIQGQRNRGRFLKK